jgi:hypothetical protein
MVRENCNDISSVTPSRLSPPQNRSYSCGFDLPEQSYRPTVGMKGSHIPALPMHNHRHYDHSFLRREIEAV